MERYLKLKMTRGLKTSVSEDICMGSRNHLLLGISFYTKNWNRWNSKGQRLIPVHSLKKTKPKLQTWQYSVYMLLVSPTKKSRTSFESETEIRFEITTQVNDFQLYLTGVTIQKTIEWIKVHQIEYIILIEYIYKTWTYADQVRSWSRAQRVLSYRNRFLNHRCTSNRGKQNKVSWIHYVCDVPRFTVPIVLMLTFLATKLADPRQKEHLYLEY